MYYLIKWILCSGALLSLTSCSHLSKVGPPPKIDQCQLKVIPQANTTVLVTARCKNQKGVKFDLPITKMDKYQCFHPEQFVDGIIYIDKLLSVMRTEMAGN